MDETQQQFQVSAVLDNAPIGILLTGGGVIIGVNARLAEWLGTRPDALAGMTTAEAEELGLAPLLDDSQLVELTRGNSVLRLRRSGVALANGSQAAYFEDCTELTRLEAERDHFRELAQNLETKDPETGLLNRNAILGALNSQVSRSRRYGNALSVIRLRFTRPPDERRGIPLKSIAQELNAELRWADEIGRLDDDAFLLVLPETTGTDADALAAKIGHDRAAIARSQGWGIDLAVAAWQPGDDARKLLHQLKT